MVQICNIEECTGCSTCESVCKLNAIKMIVNAKGFLEPLVDEHICVECGACVAACPVNDQRKNQTRGTVFAAWEKDLTDRRNSTSGGVFMTLARRVLRENGIVYGAGYDEQLKVMHKRVTNENDLKDLQGSKYVQSNTIGIFKTVKKDLDQGRYVLFSGTPCQVAGLKGYIKKDYENLICVDILCHGVPSPKVFEDYKKWLSARYSSKIKSVRFREKIPGWTIFSMKVDFEDKQSYIATKFADPYLNFFLVGGGDLTLRESCFKCKFTSPERCGDITLADFWFIEASSVKYKGIENGVGLVLVNSEKGNGLFSRCKDELFLEQHTWEEALKSNRSFLEPWAMPKKYHDYWNDYRTLEFQQMVDKYQVSDSETEQRQKKYAWIRAHMYLMPTSLLKALKSVKRRLRG